MCYCNTRSTLHHTATEPSLLKPAHPNLKCVVSEAAMWQRLKYNFDNKCAIMLNKYVALWFESATGIRQGDSLSPTLFSIFINDLAFKISSKHCGVQVALTRSSILLYADYIALIVETAEEMQPMLTTVESWCNKWRLKPSKSQIVPFRQQSCPKTSHSFQSGSST